MAATALIQNRQGEKPVGIPESPLLIGMTTRSHQVPTVMLQELVHQLYRGERIPLYRKVSLIFCTNYAIRKLNARYRGIDRPTDVLSFTMGDDDLLGEIYISLQRAEVQSRRFGTGFDCEIARLFVHGFFHLLG